MKSLAVIFLYFLTVNSGCGTSENPKTQQRSPTVSSTSEKTGETRPEIKFVVLDRVQFRGYVVNAFSVTVEGTEYLDMEDFYTQATNHLPEKVKNAGHDSTYKASFKAQIGLRDLWNNMDVYISTDNSAGYRGYSTVKSDGIANWLSKSLERSFKVIPPRILPRRSPNEKNQGVKGLDFLTFAI
ncbi:MAG: hypothetical protein HQK54_10850 [Oligoflexales bacterium]|nr:hypothetical protein [Oligoflexales bacterium]